MFVTRARAVCVIIATSRHRYVILGGVMWPRNHGKNYGGRNRTEKGRPVKSGVCIGGIANDNITGNLVSCLEEINAHLRIKNAYYKKNIVSSFIKYK